MYKLKALGLRTSWLDQTQWSRVCSQLCPLLSIYLGFTRPELFHNVKHDPNNYRECSQVSLKTFIDDAILKNNEKNNKDIKNTIQNTNGPSRKVH